jgi:hypothetical protein
MKSKNAPRHLHRSSLARTPKEYDNERIYSTDKYLCETKKIWEILM